MGFKYIRYIDNSSEEEKGFHGLNISDSIHPSSILASVRGNPSPAIAYTKSELFMSDFRSRIYLTYRYNFPTLLPSQYTSDAGWGCMLRSGQMVLAQALILHILGREWRFGLRGVSDERVSDEVWNSYLELISWFIDSPKALFSIHQITKLGLELDLPVGEWYGPSTIAQSLKKLVNNSKISGMDSRKLFCYVAQDATVYKSHIQSIFSKDEKYSLVLLVPVRLGVDKLNPIYYSSILWLFQLTSFIGIAGGRPNSAVYFVGVNPATDELLYLDPHISRPCVPYKKDKNDYTIEELMTYHCDIVRTVKVNKLDPSLLLGFYCSDKEQFEDLLQVLEESFQKNPLFSILDQEPSYFESSSAAMEDGDWHDLVE